MATRTRKSSSRVTFRDRSKTPSDRSAFSFGSSGTAALVSAAIGGAAFAIAANLGRKFFIQSMSAKAGDWDEMLAADHEAALAIFDKMLGTDPSQAIKRTMLLRKLGHALDKHTHEEENVVYPALRQADDRYDADLLEGEHGYVKTYLYELDQMGTDAPNWLEKVRQFRGVVEKHARMEEEEVFPRLKSEMTEEQNAKITRLVNKDGFMMA
ncbi:MAG TPA: hemerythrin domain-containing protein [Sphingomicrobium sp.]|nr:hemerythrin domain-containing protein [Sphingomicrobium sp.]